MVCQSAYVCIYLLWLVVWQLVRIYILGDFIIPRQIPYGLNGWSTRVSTFVVVVFAAASVDPPLVRKTGPQSNKIKQM
jgi:hypothetical protein